MNTFKIIRVDGTTEVINKPTLEQMQKAVGGYIEMIRISPDTMMWVNEEGRLLKLKINQAASFLAQQTIVGDVILEVGNDRDG